MMGLIDHPLSPLIVAWALAAVKRAAYDTANHRAMELAQRNLLNAALSPWQPIDTIPQDRPIDGWHKVWKCPVTIAYRSWGDRSAWVEKTLTTEWPIEAFSHWRETSEDPSRDLLNAALEELK